VENLHPPGTLHDLRPTRRTSLQVIWAYRLPIAALAFLVLGAIAYFWPPFRGEAHIIWLVGLVLTGAPVLWQTLRGMIHGRFAADIVAALALITAIILNEPLPGLVVVLMQTGGESLERYAEGRASAAVRALEEEAPRIAHRIVHGTTPGADPEGTGPIAATSSPETEPAGAGTEAAAPSAEAGMIEDIPAEDVAVGDLILVRPGEMIPCDGIVTDGRAHVDASRITGEPTPISAAPGTSLLSGSLNGEAPLTLRATRISRESQYARIVELVRTAQASKSPLQRLADRYAVWFTPLTLAVAGAAFILSGDPMRILAVLVVATPCPLILATPVAIIGGINSAARHQIVIRSGTALEQLGKVKIGVFDKTGTLTVGIPEVDRVVPVPSFDEREVLRLAAAVEQNSGHLLARTVVAEALARGITLPPASGVREAPGMGVSGTVEGRQVAIGSRHYLEELGAAGTAQETPQGAGPEAFSPAERGTVAPAPDQPAPAPQTAAAPAAPATPDQSAKPPAHTPEPSAGLVSYIMIDGNDAGRIEYADRLRPGLAPFFRELRELGIEREVLLSGDHEAHVRDVAREVDIPEAYAELLPQDKVRFVRELNAEGHQTLMVGDGINDAPALSTATVGIALAGHGGGITAEAADIVILVDELDRVADAVRISQGTLRIAHQSIWVGLGLSGAFMIVAALGHIPPTIGAFIQEGIDVTVILNAIRASALGNRG
jgi:cation transport ATPase